MMMLEMNQNSPDMFGAMTTMWIPESSNEVCLFFEYQTSDEHLLTLLFIETSLDY